MHIKENNLEDTGEYYVEKVNTEADKEEIKLREFPAFMTFCYKEIRFRLVVHYVPSSRKSLSAQLHYIGIYTLANRIHVDAIAIAIS